MERVERIHGSQEVWVLHPLPRVFIQKGPEEVVCFCCRIDMISVALFEKGNWKIPLGLVPLDCWKVLIGGFEIV